MLRFLVVCCLVVTCLGQLPPSEEFTHNAVLDANGDVRLWWSFNDTYITFEMQVKTTGWVGIGISPGGGMTNADIYTGSVANGMTSVTDRRGPSSGNSFPTSDAEQNVENLGGLEQDGWTRIKFRRTIVACDSDDITITDSTMRVIYAFGTNEDSDINYHGTTNRGTKSILILAYGNTGAIYPAGETQHSSFDVLADNFNVPAESTYYNCRLLQVPKNITTKQHIVTIAPIVQAGNEANVHHILLYACFGFESTENLGVDAKCYTPNMPPEHANCSALLAAWAIGGTDFNFPHHAGFPIGEVDSPKYLLMETHYDNPTSSGTIVDSSGLRMTYTPQLRANDAGVMIVGHTVSPILHYIPPKAETFESIGECSPMCLQQGLDGGNVSSINIFASVLHSHLLGTAIQVEQIRDGVELQPISEDFSYDFNYQETRWLPQERAVLPGDTLRVICTYNSMGRDAMTFGGLGTVEEMCMTFLYYYPKIPLTDCSSHPSDAYLIWRDYFGIIGLDFPTAVDAYTTLYDANVTFPASLAGKTIAQVMNEVAWNETVADEFSVVLRQQEAGQRCLIDGEVGTTFNYTTVTQEYVPPPTNCATDVTTSAVTTSNATQDTNTAAVTTTTVSTTSAASGLKTSAFVALVGAVVTAASSLI